MKHTIDTQYHIMDRNQPHPLEKLNSIVDLGVHFDSNLTFRDHISEKINKAYSVSCSSKSRLVLTFLVLPFWYLLTRVDPDIFQTSSKMVVVVLLY